MSGEGAIEIIMVGSPGVLIVREPGTGAAQDTAPGEPRTGK